MNIAGYLYFIFGEHKTLKHKTLKIVNETFILGVVFSWAVADVPTAGEMFLSLLLFFKS